MPQYDAGPGDWSDRDWEAPDHKSATQAKRRLTLPPWVLVTAAAVIAILSCIGLVLVVNHARQKGEATATVEVKAATQAVAFATAVLTPTATTEITPKAVPGIEMFPPGEGSSHPHQQFPLDARATQAS